MSLSKKQIDDLRQRINSLSPDERALLRELAAEEKPKRQGPTVLPRKKAEPPEPQFETIRSWNGELKTRRKR